MTPDTAKAVLSFILGTIEREHAATLRVLRAVPEGKEDYSPDSKSMNAIDLAWHTASSELYFLNSMAAGGFPEGTSDDGKRPASIKSGADVAAWYEKEWPQVVEKVKALSPEQCVVVLNFHDMFKMPVFAWGQLAITHSIHHRGQLSAYLRPMGGKVPSIYGPSADVTIEQLAAAQNA